MDSAEPDGPVTMTGPEGRYHLAVRASMDGFWDYSTVGEGALWWSDRLYTLLDQAQDCEPSWGLFLDLQHPQDRERWEMALQQHLDSRADLNVELRLRHGNGSYNWYRLHARSTFDARGHLLRMVGSVSDIEPQKQAETLLRNVNHQLELRVAERTADLVLANANLRRKRQLLLEHNDYLRDFAAFASHDLREPLRKVRAYGDLLREEIDDHLNDDAQDYLARMTNAAERMERLIDDLLVYSRTTGLKLECTAVDLDGVLQNVLSDLELTIGETAAQVRADPLPVVQGSQPQLHQVFQNLIANSIKYRTPGETPQIVITTDTVELCPLATEDDAPAGQRSYVRICFADNGIGFEQRHAERIFLPFKRLNSRHAYQGSGIGLAVCRRVVERHNGMIHAQSAPGRGTRVFVTLPMLEGV